MEKLNSVASELVQLQADIGAAHLQAMSRSKNPVQAMAEVLKSFGPQNDADELNQDVDALLSGSAATLPTKDSSKTKRGNLRSQLLSVSTSE